MRRRSAQGGAPGMSGQVQVPRRASTQLLYAAKIAAETAGSHLPGGDDTVEKGDASILRDNIEQQLSGGAKLWLYPDLKKSTMPERHTAEMLDAAAKDADTQAAAAALLRSAPPPLRPLPPTPSAPSHVNGQLSVPAKLRLSASCEDQIIDLRLMESVHLCHRPLRIRAIIWNIASCYSATHRLRLWPCPSADGIVSI